MSLNIGDVIDGKYRIVRLLGEGGMGAVYEGENVRIHRRVAIKILHSNVAESQDAVQRFEREAQAAGRIGSDHIVEVLDLGDLPDGDRYMVMEFLEGEALNDRIKNTGGLPPRKAAEIVVDMLEGLRAAHDAGIVHRDLKPENVFLLTNKGGKADYVKIVDFGISKFSALGGEFSMTRTGAVMGTPYYLSPEQAKGERSLDHRADLYAVGVILYEAVAGAVPFDGETFNELLFKIVLEPVKPLSTIVPGIDPDFSKIVEKAMARDPEERFQSAEQLKQVLEVWLEGQPVALPTKTAGGAVASARTATPATTMEKTALGMAPGAGVAGGLPAQTAMGPQGAPPQTVNKTHGAWANTNPDGTPASPATKKWGILAAAAILLVGGGVFVMRSQAGAAEEAAAAARAEEEREKAEAEERARQEKLAELEAEKAKAEADKVAAEKARLEAEKRAVEARLSAVEQARLQEEKDKEKATTRAPAPAPAPVARPAAPRPAPQPKSTGRKFRTDI